ncbi:hypothetical protein LJY25_00940 [Hymenobacter sp. BT175]|uniref:hypothetical protein n=1 Tax=Hymenobacter translucens TaxID=2886507 RepID=UPI001D0E57EE|nr:hypothetical protein [Hymenobacter translucens]MCC2544995.1 hypothetical protein [Hymenobacter translucens]
MRMLLLTVLVLAGLPVSTALAQRVLLQSEVASDTLYSGFGPNRGYYNHLYLGYAPVIGEASAPGAALRYGASGDFFVGIRNKVRLHQALAVGIDLRLDWLTYSLVQNAAKTVPNAQQHSTENLSLQQLQTEVFTRFNVGRRGNAIGRYLDLSGWGGYVIGSSHSYTDRPGTNGTRKTVVTERGLSYVTRWPYGVGARVGSGRYALLLRYRLSDSYRGAEKELYPEMPRWLVGLELGWL